MNFTDQQLSAYLDGELPEAEARVLEAALRTDAALRDALARLQNVDIVLTETLGDIIDEPVPEHIAALVADPEPAPAAPEARRSVISLSAWRKRMSGLTMPVGLAASLMVGLIVGGQFSDLSVQEAESVMIAGEVDPGSALYAVLETAPSGATVSGLSPTLSFTSETGVCREISAPSQRALACRAASVWTVLVVTHQTPSNAGAGYQTASAETSILFDVLADQLMTGPPMAADIEAARIENGWRDPDQSPED